MSQNDWTGLEGLKDSELVSQAYHEFNDLVHPPLFMELAKRLEANAADVEQSGEIDRKCLDLNIPTSAMLDMAEAMIDCPNTTIALLDALRDHDIESADTLRAILDAVRQIQKAA